MNRTEFNKILEQHYRANFKSLVKGMSSRAISSTAEDVVQEAYTRALQYWDTYDPAQSFDAWLKSIMSNALMDNNRKERKRGMVPNRVDDPMDDPVEFVDFEAAQNLVSRKNPEHGLNARRVITHINGYKDERQRAILWSHFIEGETVVALSDKFNLSRVSIHKMTAKFKRQLDLEAVSEPSVSPIPNKRTGPTFLGQDKSHTKPSPVRVIDPKTGDQVKTIPVLDNPAAILKLKDLDNLKFLMRRRSTQKRLKQVKKAEGAL